MNTTADQSPGGHGFREPDVPEPADLRFQPIPLILGRIVQDPAPGRATASTTFPAQVTWMSREDQGEDSHPVRWNEAVQHAFLTEHT